MTAVADVYVRELKEDVALGVRNERHPKNYVPVVERYLKAYFGTKVIGTIDNADIAEYQKWRSAYWISGPGPKPD